MPVAKDVQTRHNPVTPLREFLCHPERSPGWVGVRDGTRSLRRRQPPRIRAARAAAFLALSTPTAATGTPGGIWTIESNASSPSRTLFSERNGTPITGRSVCAATTPGRAAASPAPAIRTRIPRSRAPRAYSATASGSRCAERTSSSWEIPRPASSSSAGCMRSRSDSEPTRIPTRGRSAADTALDGGQGNVAPEAHARKGDSRRGVVRGDAGRGEVVADGGHVENPPAVRDQPVAPACGAGVEDERSGSFRFSDSFDRGAGVASLRIVAAGEHDRDRRTLADLRGACELAGGGAPESAEQIALEPRQNRLRLRIAETAVELEYPRAVLGQHQPGVEQSGEGRPALLDLRLAESRDRGVGAHAAGVRTRVPVADTLEILCRGECDRAVAVGQREQRDLLPFQELLDHDLVPERSGGPQARVELVLRPADEDALARGEAVGLDDARGPRDREPPRGRDARGLEHLLGEALRALETRCRAGRPEDGEPAVAQRVGEPGHQRRLGPDHYEVDRELAAERQQAFGVFCPNRMTFPELSDSGVARRGVQ